MATLAQIVYDIREAIKDYTDDSELDDRYITYLVNIKREKYLKQRIDRLGRNFNNRILQTLCLDLEEVTTAECGLSLPCSKIVRTTKPLPDLIQLTLNDAIQRVAPADKLSQKFNFINRERAILYLHSNFPKKIKTFLHDDGHLYFISSDKVLSTCISITAVFQDPTELINYSNCCDCNTTVNSCFDINETEYPIDGELLDLVRAEVINELGRRDSIKEDINNNTKDD